MTAKNRKSNIAAARDVTTGTPIRFETAASARKKRHPARAVLVAAPEEFAGGFVDFLKDNAVVGVAVGFVIGLQAQTFMKQLVASIIDPAFSLLFGQALSQRTLTLTFHGRTGVFTWGALCYSFLSFLFVLASIYIIYRLFKLDKLKKLEEEKKK